MILVLLGSAIWFLVQSASYLRNPQDGDLYAHTWGFQFLVFVMFRLPLAFLLLGIVLAVEYAAIRAWTRMSVKQQ